MGAMSQKPVTMEQLKQILQLKNDGIAIREIAMRTGLSRNSVRKYLLLLKADSVYSEALSNKALADKAYGSDVMEHNATVNCNLYHTTYIVLNY